MRVGWGFRRPSPESHLLPEQGQQPRARLLASELPLDGPPFSAAYLSWTAAAVTALPVQPVTRCPVGEGDRSSSRLAFHTVVCEPRASVRLFSQ